ncbi:MAG: hypothetical protein KME26_15250 [Oscillatoria princeps RMCB-10]|jgi:hypothetical protein|nr:hypothetical protein [Oscillatoria princeps RMCB-10]
MLRPSPSATYRQTEQPTPKRGHHGGVSPHINSPTASENRSHVAPTQSHTLFRNVIEKQHYRSRTLAHLSKKLQSPVMT